MTAQMAEKKKNLYCKDPGHPSVLFFVLETALVETGLVGIALVGTTCIALRNSFYLNDLLCFSFGLPKAMPKSEIKQ